NLNKTVALFDKTLNGLIVGDMELGLPKTENSEIVAQLTVVKENCGYLLKIVYKKVILKL
ncbi:MAG: hypothetical protein ABGW74_02890, partial [Campylobacterales bacterium]